MLWATVLNNGGGLATAAGALFAEVLAYDDASNSTKSQALYTTLINTNNCDYTLGALCELSCCSESISCLSQGPYGSSFTQLTAPLVEKHGKVLNFFTELVSQILVFSSAQLMVAGNAAADSAYQTGKTHALFGVVTTGHYYAASALELLYSLGARSIALLQANGCAFSCFLCSLSIVLNRVNSDRVLCRVSAACSHSRWRRARV